MGGSRSGRCWPGWPTRMAPEVVMRPAQSGWPSGRDSSASYAKGDCSTLGAMKSPRRNLWRASGRSSEPEDLPDEPARPCLGKRFENSDKGRTTGSYPGKNKNTPAMRACPDKRETRCSCPGPNKNASRTRVHAMHTVCTVAVASVCLKQDQMCYPDKSLKTRAQADLSWNWSQALGMRIPNALPPRMKCLPPPGNWLASQGTSRTSRLDGCMASAAGGVSHSSSKTARLLS